MRSAIYKIRHATLFLLDLPKWVTRLPHSGTSVLHRLLFLPLYMFHGLSVLLQHVDVPCGKHPDKEIRLHTFGQTISQLPAGIDPFNFITCRVVLLGSFLSIDPKRLTERREFDS